MTRVAAVCGALPDVVAGQVEATEAFADLVLGSHVADVDRRRDLLRRVHASAGVRTRHLVQPLSAYREMGSDGDAFGAANDVFIDAGTRLGSGRSPMRCSAAA